MGYYYEQDNFMQLPFTFQFSRDDEMYNLNLRLQTARAWMAENGIRDLGVDAPLNKKVDI